MGLLSNLFSKKQTTDVKNQDKEYLEKNGDWEALLKMLGRSQRWKEMEELAQAIVRIGNKDAVPGLVALVIQSYQNGTKAAEKRAELENDPQALLMERLRKQTGIPTVGYDPQKAASPINKLNEVVGCYFTRGHKALDALIGLRAIDEIQALLDNPTCDYQSKQNFSSALRKINEAISKENIESSQSTLSNNLEIQKEVSGNASESDIKAQLKIIRSKFSILENAYVASNIKTGPKEMAEIEKVLSDILSEGNIGLYFLLERIMVGVTFSGNNISLHNWGEDTTNELIKKQIIIKVLGTAKAKGAIPELEKLSKATCSYSQWRECIVGPLNRAIASINS